MPGLRDKLRMWQVSVYERSHHTNPVATIYIRAWDRLSAVSESMHFLRLHNIQEFQRIDSEWASWKQEEEFCTPWSKVDLP
jgi:hypothetical protein